ncbi:hypothetical protein MASR2M29_21490 [Spirochaetota bacterium]
MKADKIITQKDINDTRIVLKPVFGIKPRLYVPFFYSLAIILIFFLVLFYPGLKNPGSHYVFTTDPPGSAIFIDGVYKATSPCSIFVSRGEHNISIQKPGFLSHNAYIKAPARVFASLLFKQKKLIKIELVPDKPEYLLKMAYEAYSNWNLGPNPSLSYQMPMLLSDAAMAASMDPLSFDAKALASMSAAVASNAAAFRDAVRAASIAYSGSMGLSATSLGRLADTLFQELAENPAILAALAPFLSSKDSMKLESNPFYKKAMTRAKALAQSIKKADTKIVSIAGLDFVSFSSGTAVIAAAASFPKAVELAPFMLAVHETSVGEYRKFLEANPYWSKDNISELLAEGLVSEDYLKDLDQCDSDDVLSYVSRPAAMAYCKWMDRLAPSSYRFALPSEAQWTLAAQAAGASAKNVAILANSAYSGPQKPKLLERDAAGFKGLLGNVWEWSSSSYYLFPSAASKAKNIFANKNAVVRGASWANNPELVNLDSRGPVAENSSNAYLGFRIALVSKED